MLVDTMDAEIRKWGNSYAIRVPKGEMERLGLHEGDRVDVTIAKLAGRRKRVSLAGMPVFHDTARDVSQRHDAYLYGDRR